jgi:3',5'-cyclic AMP phosphodiesterase CpdA
VARINALPRRPDFLIHSGDLTQLSTPKEFDTVAEILKGVKVGQIFYVPGEHDVIGDGSEFLKRFGSVTVLNGHIHQIAQKVEGNMTFHTARSTGFPQPAPGQAPAAGRLKNVPAEKLRTLLGLTNVNYVGGRGPLAIVDEALQ